MIKQIYCLQIWLLFLVVANAQSYGRHKHQQQYENQIIDPILTPIINWFDLYNKQQEGDKFAHSIDEPNSVTHVPSPILRSFKLYPVATTTAVPNFMDDFLRPFIEPFQREFQKSNNQIRQIPSNQQYTTLNSRKYALQTLTTTQTPLATLLESIGMNAKPKEELQVGRDKTVNILGMDVGQKDGLMLSPLKGLSLGKQNLFGPVAVHDDYKIGWNFLDNIGDIFMPKRY